LNHTERVATSAAMDVSIGFWQKYFVRSITRNKDKYSHNSDKHKLILVCIDFSSDDIYYYTGFALTTVKNANVYWTSLIKSSILCPVCVSVSKIIVSYSEFY